MDNLNPFDFLVIFLEKRIFNGGAGGNRTPVRESSADSSTYLAYYLI